MPSIGRPNREQGSRVANNKTVVNFPKDILLPNAVRSPRPWSEVNIILFKTTT